MMRTKTKIWAVYSCFRLKTTIKLPLLLLTIIFLFSCGEKQGDRALVTGTIKGLTNDTLLVFGSDQMFDRVDTLYVRNGKIKRYIPVDTLAQAWIMYKDGSRVPLFLNKRSDIRIKGDTASLLRLQIEDKAENHLLTQFTQQHDSALTVALIDSFIAQHPSSVVSFYLINRYLREAPVADRLLVQPLLQHYDEEMKHHPQYIAINERLAHEAKADSGSSVSYFRLRGTDNKYVSRTDFSNRWLLIHFWASWSDASVRQLRTLYKPIYKSLQKDKVDDFGLWGISLDFDRNAWRKAVAKDTIDWKQGCDGKGWLSEPATLFDIRNLPSNVLISPDGKIMAYNLSKKQIEDKIKAVKQEMEEKKKKEKEKKKK